MRRTWTVLGRCWMLLAGLALLIAACGEGGESPTGPTVNVGPVHINCAEEGDGGRGGSSGDTTVTIVIDPSCVRDNNPTTTTTTK